MAQQKEPNYDRVTAWMVFGQLIIQGLFLVVLGLTMVRLSTIHDSVDFISQKVDSMEQRK